MNADKEACIYLSHSCLLLVFTIIMNVRMLYPTISFDKSQGIIGELESSQVRHCPFKLTFKLH